MRGRMMLPVQASCTGVLQTWFGRVVRARAYRWQMPPIAPKLVLMEMHVPEGDDDDDGW